MAQLLTNLTGNHEVRVRIPGLAQWVKYPALRWAVVYVADTARMPLAWGPPYAAGSGPRNGKKTKKKKKKKDPAESDIPAPSSKVTQDHSFSCGTSVMSLFLASCSILHCCRLLKPSLSLPWDSKFLADKDHILLTFTFLSTATVLCTPVRSKGLTKVWTNALN